LIGAGRCRLGHLGRRRSGSGFAFLDDREAGGICDLHELRHGLLH
jgi:hypothetical protein